MKLSKEKYSVQREPVRLWLKNKPKADLLKEISYIAISTNVPIIIVVEYVMEIVGRTEELLSTQKRLMEFYHIDEIV